MAFTADRAVTDIGRLRIKIEPVIYSDTALNDSDKSLDLSSFLGDGESLEITGVRMELTATATVGTRTPVFEVQNASSDVVWSYDLTSNAQVTASNSVVVEASAGRETVSAAVGTITPDRFPEGLFLDSGHTFRVYDSAAIDAAADDMVVHVRGVIRR